MYMSYDYFIEFMITPFQENIRSEFGKELFAQSLFEGFLTKLKVSLIAGTILALPIYLYHIIKFTFPALKRKEKVTIISGLGVSILLIWGSVYLTFFKLVPFILTFLTSSGFIPNKIGLLLNYQSSILYIIQFVLYSALAFQFPILLEVCLALNLVTRKTLYKYSKYIIIGIVILSALVTPPDFVSQLGLSIPLILLYFLTLLIAKIFKWGES